MRGTIENRRLSWAVIMCLLAVCAVIVSAFGASRVHALDTAYYVDAVSGSDTNDGLTEATAWRTYTRAYSMRGSLQPGDKVLFKRGQTFAATGSFTTSTSGVAGSPIVIGSYGDGARPVLAYTATTHAIDLRNDSHIVVEGLDIRGFSSTGVVVGVGVQDVALRDLNISSTSGHGIAVTAGSSDVTIEDVVISGVGSRGITVDATDGLTISRVHISGIGADGITVQRSQNVHVSEAVVNGNGGRGIYVFGTGNHNYVVRDSEFNNNGGNGVSLAGDGDGFTATRVVANNNYDGFNVHFDWHNVIFEYCTANENGQPGTPGPDGDGFTFHETSSGIIRYSTAHNNVKTAVAHVGSSNVEMYYNIFSHDTRGELALVYLGDANGDGTHVLANNVIYSGDTTGTGVHVLGAVSATLHNNIISGFANGIVSETTGTLVEDYNMVHGATTPFVGMVPGGHTLQVDPLFVDAARGDFRVQSGSPAIDAGMTLAYDVDFAGATVPQGGATDIGVFEQMLAAPDDEGDDNNDADVAGDLSSKGEQTPDSRGSNELASTGQNSALGVVVGCVLLVLSLGGIISRVR